MAVVYLQGRHCAAASTSLPSWMQTFHSISIYELSTACTEELVQTAHLPLIHLSEKLASETLVIL